MWMICLHEEAFFKFCLPFGEVHIRLFGSKSALVWSLNHIFSSKSLYFIIICTQESSLSRIPAFPGGSAVGPAVINTNASLSVPSQPPTTRDKVVSLFVHLVYRKHRQAGRLSASPVGYCFSREIS